MSFQISADWLARPATKAVMSALERAAPDTARFVGGCVRNTVMGRPVDDIDIATQLEPPEVIAALEAASIRAIPTGLEHGTVTAVLDHTPFEITSLRRDVETDGRRATVAFTRDWEEDAARRDFRLNALYAASDGAVFDPTGGGIDDAQSGQVIFIGDADTRLREDYLRILRFFRFNAWYGAEIDAAGLAACQRQVEGLRQIASERTWKELKKMLCSPNVTALQRSLLAMQEGGVLGTLLPVNLSLDGVSAVLFAEQGGAPHDDPIRRLMGLLRDNPEAVAQVSETLRLSKAEATRLQAWASPNVQCLNLSDRAKVQKALYRHGAETVLDRAATLAMASMYLYSDIFHWKRPKFPLTGDDALAAGLEGREIGEALDRLSSLWVDSNFSLDRAALLDLL